MSILPPPKLLPAWMSNPEQVSTYSAISDIFYGKPNAWQVNLYVTSVEYTSYPGSRNDYHYNALDIKIGDWIASASGGKANRIISIVGTLTTNMATIIVDDPNSYNALLDSSGTGSNGLTPQGSVWIFSIGSNGLPILTPEISGTFDPIFTTDIISRFFYADTSLGSSIGSSNDTLETPTIDSRNITLGAITSWQIGSTTYTDAIVGLNDMLGKLIPSPPPNLSNFVLTISNVISRPYNLLLSSGVVDNIPSHTSTAGSQVAVITSSTATTSNISGFGSGNSGSLTVLLNGSIISSTAIAKSGTLGTFNNTLRIIADVDYPSATPGFWKALTTNISTTVPVGVNKLQFIHSETGAATPVIFVYDSLTSAPVASSLSVTEGSVGSYTYSSGVPHYTSGATLLGRVTVSNLAGETYLASNNIEFVVSSGLSNVALGPAQILSGTTIFSDKIAAQSVSSIAITLTSNAATTATLSVRGRNSFNDGSYLAFPSSINPISLHVFFTKDIHSFTTL